LFKLRFVDESPKQPPHPLLLLASSTALFTARPILAAPFAVHFAAPSTLYRRLAATFGDRQRARSSLTTRQLLRLLNASKLRQQLLLKLPPTPQHQPFSSFPSLPSNNMNDDNNYRRRFENVHHAFRLQDLRNPQRLRCSTGHYNMPRSSDTAHLVSGSRIHLKASAPGNYDLLLGIYDHPAACEPYGPAPKYQRVKSKNLFSSSSSSSIVTPLHSLAPLQRPTTPATTPTKPTTTTTVPAAATTTTTIAAMTTARTTTATACKNKKKTRNIFFSVF
jgi:hypothetical protein